jgi:hypothetical protein
MTLRRDAGAFALAKAFTTDLMTRTSHSGSSERDGS